MGGKQIKEPQAENNCQADSAGTPDLAKRHGLHDGDMQRLTDYISAPEGFGGPILMESHDPIAQRTGNARRIMQYYSLMDRQASADE